ncbi:MAG: hypothetical protein AAF226_07700 [Verrucomicrobiota bacterium]
MVNKDEPKWLTEAWGYIELGMYDEAWKVLDTIAGVETHEAEALSTRISIALDEGKASKALPFCEELCKRFATCPEGFVQGAYCLHALGKTESARELLQSGPQSLRKDHVYFYNLACYEAALGNDSVGMAWLRRSIEIDPKARVDALRDKDLEVYWPELQEC